MTTGKINVSVENIFPLIKKFLYSDHEIFLRELVSNGTDATLKLKHLISIGEAKVEYGNPIIEVKIDNLEIGKDIRIGDLNISGLKFLEPANVVITAVKATRNTATAAAADDKAAKKK